jgi:V/A-type H+/Na+-transporting ATPase subunit E
MTGLEKILKAIEDEAQASADAVIAQAKTEADRIHAEAKAEAEKQGVQIAEKSEAEIKAILSRAESSAALQEKKIILESKQQIISNIITKARESLDHLPDNEFTDIILEMVKKHAHQKQGKILFSAADKTRLPKDFEDRLKISLSSKPSASLTLAAEAADNGGGFLLVYGDIEENCSFDALFSAEKENLQDKVNSLLFE